MTMSSSVRVGVHWFRKGLRIHDNKPLLQATEQCDTLIPLYIIDEQTLNPTLIGTNRFGFLLETLKSLDDGLRKLGSRLVVAQGPTFQVLEAFLMQFKPGLFTFEKDTEEINKLIDEKITQSACSKNIKVQSYWGHTLFDPDYLLLMNNGKAPLTMAGFLSNVADAGLPEIPVKTPESIPPVPADVSCGDIKIYNDVPTLEDFKGYGYKSEKTSWISGGEDQAFQQMEKFLSQRSRVLDFEKPKTNPTALEPDTTVLSPYLSVGSLSVRLFYFRLKEILGPGPPASSKPPVTLEDQLYWRELSYLIAYSTPNFDRMKGNPICMQIPWIDGPKAIPLVQRWSEGKTGFPAVDAAMKQLFEDGWIHHLARHLVACFLTIGDLWVTWELGRCVLERYLIDHDLSVNNFSWQWLSSSAYFEEYSKCYGPVTSFQRTDPSGAYIRKYIPVLRNFPDKYIYEPWTAPKKVQEVAGCIIGKDYPKPMVDHAKASKENMAKMKAAFDHAKAYGLVFFNAGYPSGAFFPKSEKKQHGDPKLKLFGMKLHAPMRKR